MVIVHRWKRSHVTTVNLSQDPALEADYCLIPELPRDFPWRQCCSPS